MTPEEKRLRRELQELQAEVRTLRTALGSQGTRLGQLEGLRGQRVFLARHDGAGGAWQELVPTGDGTTLGDYVGGRHSTTNDIIVDPAAAAEDENVCAVLQTRNAAGRRVFVQLTGAAESKPEFAGQAHVGVANGVAGWDLLPLTDIEP